MRSNAQRLRGETVSLMIEVPVVSSQTIIGRSAARDAGMTSYFTGKNCCRGHVARRTVASGRCWACAKEIDVQFRHRYRARATATSADWVRRNPEKTRASKKRDYQKNKSAYASYGKRRRALHAVAIAEYMRKWRDKNRYKSNAYRAARRGRTRQAALWGADGVAAIYTASALIRRAMGWDVQVDHIIPLKGKTASGLHVPANLQIIPARMNRQKGASLLPDIQPPPIDPDAQTLRLVVRADGTWEYNGVSHDAQ